MHNNKQRRFRQYKKYIYITIYKQKSREISLIVLKIVRSTLINNF